ncbi:MAG: DNA-3-methyladenine glycosylase I [Microcella sp.]
MPDTAPASPAPSTLLGPDGRQRCAWVGDTAELRVYHDDEWGVPVRGDHALFERIALEGFQSGLSWLTILRRREGFRRAFAGFEPSAVAGFDERDVARLLDDSAIIRNRRKIEATIANARVLVAWQAEHPHGLDALVWSFAPEPSERRRPATLAEVPASTDASRALAAALKERGLRFVGPTTMYALMQATGVVNDHVVGCWRARD